MLDSVYDAGTILSAIKLLGTRLILRRFIDRFVGCVTHFRKEAADRLSLCSVSAAAGVALEAK